MNCCSARTEEATSYVRTGKYEQLLTSQAAIHALSRNKINVCISIFNLHVLYNIYRNIIAVCILLFNLSGQYISGLKTYTTFPKGQLLPYHTKPVVSIILCTQACTYNVYTSKYVCRVSHVKDELLRTTSEYFVISTHQLESSIQHPAHPRATLDFFSHRSRT